MHTHQDDRRRFTANLFPTDGDVNVVEPVKGKVIAWHRHQLQTDYLFCARGVVKVGVIAPTGRHKAHYLHAGSGVLTIPPNHWHGYEALTDDVLMVCYISQKYNPDDEERMDHRSSGHPW